MARPQRRQLNKKSSLGPALIGAILIFFALLAAGALAYFYLSAEQKPILDADSLCPLTGPRGITVVLVDTSDALDSTTQKDVLSILDEQITSLPAYHKLDVRVLDAGALRSRSLFSKCNPGDGDGLSEWTDNPKIARQRWIEAFRTPAAEAIKGSLNSQKALNSPIMAAIQDIAIEQFKRMSVRSIPKSLVIVSDMIEHTRDYSQYPSAGDLSYERFKRSPAYEKYRTELFSAKVWIAYAYRKDSKLDGRKHGDFWLTWVKDNQGEWGSMKRLQGAN